MQNSDLRAKQLSEWLQQVLTESEWHIEPASADASFRRYFRVHTETGSLIAMDAPPDKEPITPFLAATAALATQQVHVPRIHASNSVKGFILMEDLGSTDYLSVLRRSPDEYYKKAIQALVDIQLGAVDQTDLNLPVYDAAHLEREMELFNEWYLQRHLGQSFDAQTALVWQGCKEFLIAACLEQPQVWVHRDFHSRNLMACRANPPGVIDFQDLLIGPLAYDVVSLFKDCYIEWPREQQLKWCRDYLELAHQRLLDDTVSEQQFIRWFDLTGLQRHLKVLGIFCRLHYRDEKSGYLNDLPLVRRYVTDALSRAPELSDFYEYFRGLPHA